MYKDSWNQSNLDIIATVEQINPSLAHYTFPFNDFGHAL